MPADIGFSFDVVATFFIGKVVESAAEVLIAEAGIVEEDAGLLYSLGLWFVVEADLGYRKFLAVAGDVVVLPELGCKAFGGGGDALFIGFVVVISAISATSVIRKLFIDAFTAAAEGTIPVGS